MLSLRCEKTLKQNIDLFDDKTGSSNVASLLYVYHG